jgi:D-tyrosyl-tRNA(Tyr) deacylase
MRAVIQRVKQSSVTVDGEVVGKINKGLLVLLAIHTDDTEPMIEKMASKITNLRIFEDGEGKMSRSVQDVGGSVLVVSQFTLYGDVKKGNRPGFTQSAHPDKAEPYYNRVIDAIKDFGLQVETGRFAAMMDVKLINDGPVTIIVDL